MLEAGYEVVGTVRSTNKGEYLRALFEKEFPGKFSYLIVEDIGKVASACNTGLLMSDFSHRS